jgi:hypothetical protein
MLSDILIWIAVGVLAAASISLLLARDWRWSLALLAIQYLAAFALVLQYWPLAMAVVKLITGWMATAALGMTRLNLPQAEEMEAGDSRERGFWLIAAIIVIMIGAAGAPRIEDMIPGIGLPVILGSLFTIGAGLLHLSRSSQALRVTAGLLTVLCGFEILYSAIESSILVAALLSVVNLGLALAGSYLLLGTTPPEEDEPL